MTRLAGLMAVVTVVGVSSVARPDAAADEWKGLVILDMSDPTHPVLAGRYATTGAALGVAVSGSTAFVATYSFGLLVIDVSAPSNPVQAGRDPNRWHARGVAPACPACGLRR